ncbi:MAG: hypothetical protein EOP06_12865, partial [Proteobacteria bacterium]
MSARSYVAILLIVVSTGLMLNRARQANTARATHADKDVAGAHEQISGNGADHFHENETGSIANKKSIRDSDHESSQSAQAAGANDNVAAPAQSMDLNQFRQLLARTKQDLPKLKQLRELSSKDVHHTPTLIVNAGIALGQVAQALHDNPALASEATAFYQECFLGSELPVQIRSLCLANHRKLRHQHGDRLEWNDQELTAGYEVLRLA